MKNMPSMQHKGIDPLTVIPVNGIYLLAVYQGSLSQYDLLLKYRQKLEDGRWTRIRTPKHIHWAVDILIKMYADENTTKQFVDFLLNQWHHTISPIRSEADRQKVLCTATLLHEVDQEAKHYQELSGKGEYSVKFLLLIAKLLMVQEKTNREDAYMFRKVLESLRTCP
jgi:hypothetical protein